MSTVAVNEAQLLEDAAELLGLLAAVEHAHMLGEEETIDILLSQVTETACRGVAERLRGAALRKRLPSHPPRIGASSAAHSRSIERVRRAASAVALAPIHPSLDRYNRKVW